MRFLAGMIVGSILTLLALAFLFGDVETEDQNPLLLCKSNVQEFCAGEDNPDSCEALGLSRCLMK